VSIVVHHPDSGFVSPQRRSRVNLGARAGFSPEASLFRRPATARRDHASCAAASRRADTSRERQPGRLETALAARSGDPVR